MAIALAPSLRQVAVGASSRFVCARTGRARRAALRLPRCDAATAAAACSSGWRPVKAEPAQGGSGLGDTHACKLAEGILGTIVPLCGSASKPRGRSAPVTWRAIAVGEEESHEVHASIVALLSGAPRPQIDAA